MGGKSHKTISLFSVDRNRVELAVGLAQAFNVSPSTFSLLMGPKSVVRRGQISNVDLGIGNFSTEIPLLVGR